HTAASFSVSRPRSTRCWSTADAGRPCAKTRSRTSAACYRGQWDFESDKLRVHQHTKRAWPDVAASAHGSDPPGHESSRNALIDPRRPVSGASGGGGAPSPFFGGSGDACGDARLLQPSRKVPLDYLKLLLMLGWVPE